MDAISKYIDAQILDSFGRLQALQIRPPNGEAFTVEVSPPQAPIVKRVTQNTLPGGKDAIKFMSTLSLKDDNITFTVVTRDTLRASAVPTRPSDALPPGAIESTPAKDGRLNSTLQKFVNLRNEAELLKQQAMFIVITNPGIKRAKFIEKIRKLTDENDVASALYLYATTVSEKMDDADKDAFINRRAETTHLLSMKTPANTLLFKSEDSLLRWSQYRSIQDTMFRIQTSFEDGSRKEPYFFSQQPSVLYLVQNAGEEKADASALVHEWEGHGVNGIHRLKKLKKKKDAPAYSSTKHRSGIVEVDKSWTAMMKLQEENI